MSHFASSGATTSGWEKDEPLKAIVKGRYEEVPEQWLQFNHQTAQRPNGVYGATKVCGEALGHHFTTKSNTTQQVESFFIMNRSTWVYNSFIDMMCHWF